MSILDRVSESISPKRRAPVRAEARKEIGMARAAAGSSALVQKARRVAREMAQHGPVTIEDVCDRMAAENDPVWAGSKEAPANWKGSVFNTPEFVCVNSIESRKESNNGRHVRLWALKSWLREHSMNGCEGSASAFSFMRMYNDYVHLHGDPADGELVWLVGTDLLDEHFAASVGKGRVFGVEVVAFPGVGAMLARKDEVRIRTA